MGLVVDMVSSYSAKWLRPLRREANRDTVTHPRRTYMRVKAKTQPRNFNNCLKLLGSWMWQTANTSVFNFQPPKLASNRILSFMPPTLWNLNEAAPACISMPLAFHRLNLYFSRSVAGTLQRAVKQLCNGRGQHV